VTCGPYVFTDYEDGEFYEISWNPLFHYLPSDRPVPTTSTTTTTTGTTGETTTTTGTDTGTGTGTGTGGGEIPTFDATLAIVAGAVGAAVVILVGGFVLLRQK
jgi:hypothetical protein